MNKDRKHKIKRILGLSVTLLITVLFVLKSGVLQKHENYNLPKIEHLMDEDESYEYVESFVNEVLMLESAEIIGHNPSQSKPAIYSYSISTDEVHEHDLAMDAVSGQIRSYFNSNVENDHHVQEGGIQQRSKSSDVIIDHSGVMEWIPEFEVVTREDAFESLKPILMYLEQSLEMDDYEITHSRVLNQHKTWRFSRDFEHDGVRHIDKWITIKVSQYSGRVASLHYYPVIAYPDKVESSITKEAALKKAQKSIRKNELFKWKLFSPYTKKEVDYDVGPVDIKKVTALPKINEHMQDKEKATIAKLSSIEPRYCWQIPFPYKETHGSNDKNADVKKHEVSGIYIIYVDMETGQVIR